MWFISTVDKLIIEAGNIFDWSSDKIIWRGAMKRVVGEASSTVEIEMLVCGAALPTNIDLASLESCNGKCILLMAIFFQETLKHCC